MSTLLRLRRSWMRQLPPQLRLRALARKPLARKARIPARGLITARVVPWRRRQKPEKQPGQVEKPSTHWRKGFWHRRGRDYLQSLRAPAPQLRRPAQVESIRQQRLQQGLTRRQLPRRPQRSLQLEAAR
jgi:hypothetical protein